MVDSWCRDECCVLCETLLLSQANEGRSRRSKRNIRFLSVVCWCRDVMCVVCCVLCVDAEMGQRSPSTRRCKRGTPDGTLDAHQHDRHTFLCEIIPYLPQHYLLQTNSPQLWNFILCSAGARRTTMTLSFRARQTSRFLWSRFGDLRIDQILHLRWWRLVAQRTINCDVISMHCFFLSHHFPSLVHRVEGISNVPRPSTYTSVDVLD